MMKPALMILGKTRTAFALSPRIFAARLLAYSRRRAARESRLICEAVAAEADSTGRITARPMRRTAQSGERRFMSGRSIFRFEWVVGVSQGAIKRREAFRSQSNTLSAKRHGPIGFGLPG